MEHLSLLVQIYLRMDRLDLAKQTLLQMKQSDEESVLTQLCACYVALYTGRSEAVDALHVIRSLTEQYGASTTLLNLTAASHLAAGQYSEAEATLSEAFAEGEDADMMINMIVCYQCQGKVSHVEMVVNKMKSLFPCNPFVQGLLRVEGAFERESAKYRLSA
jgi:Coatomer epsilon subunit.